MALPVLQSDESKASLTKLEQEARLKAGTLVSLLAIAARHRGMLRRRGLFQRFDEILDDGDT